MAVFLRVVTTGRLCAMDLHESLPKEPGDVVHGVRSEGHWFWRRWVFTADLGHPKVTHELNLWMGQAFASHFANSIMFRWVDEAGNQFRQTTRAKRSEEHTSELQSHSD